MKELQTSFNQLFKTKKMKTIKNILFALTLATLLSACEKMEIDSNEAHDVFYLRNNDADMPVHVKGNTASKSFILLLHGGPGGSSFPYKYGDFPALSSLEDENAVVYLDQRCSGNSTGKFDPDKLTMSLMVEDLEKLIVLLKDIYGEDISILLFGHSWGVTLGYGFLTANSQNQHQIEGFIAMDGIFNSPLLLKQQKTYISDLAERQIASGNCVNDWNKMLEDLAELDENDIDNFIEFNKLGGRVGSLMYNVDSIQVNDNGYGGMLDPRYLVNTPDYEMTYTNYIINLIAPLSDVLAHFDVTSKLQDIEIPVLLLTGRYDGVVPYTHNESALQYLGSANKSHVLFDHSGHSPFSSEPEKFIDVVTEFMAGL